MKKVVCSLILVSLLFIAGCFDYTENLVIKDDGSGTIRMQFALGKVYLEQAEAMTKELADDMDTDLSDSTDEMFSRSEIEASLKESGADIKLESYEVSETEEARIWDMSFSFKDISQLNIINQSMSSEGNEEFSVSDESNLAYTKQADGTWLFERSLESGTENNMDGDFDWNMGDEDSTAATGDDDMDEEEPGKDKESKSDVDVEDKPGKGKESESDEDAEDEEVGDFGDAMEDFAAQMQQMMEGLGKHKLSFTITFPGTIVESNATSTDGNTATWEYNLMELSSKTPTQRAVIK